MILIIGKGIRMKKILLENVGIEPGTSRLVSECSTILKEFQMLSHWVGSQQQCQNGASFSTILVLFLVDEWNKFTAAVNVLNNVYPDPEDERSQYQIIMSAHKIRNNAIAAHAGTAFLPWHREYLWRLVT